MDVYVVGLVVGVILFAAIAGVGKLHGAETEKRLERAAWSALAGVFAGLILLGLIWSVISSL